MAGGSATQVVGVEMPSGETLWARISVDPDAVTDSALGFKRFLGRLERLDDTIRGVVHSVAASVARYSPAETEVEFGIEVAGETGMAFAVLAGAHASASVKIKMTWRKGEFPVLDGDGDRDGHGDRDGEGEGAAGPESGAEQGAAAAIAQQPQQPPQPGSNTAASNTAASNTAGTTAAEG